MSIHQCPQTLPLVEIELCECEHAALILINSMRMNKVTNKHNVLQEEDGGTGKCMIDRGLRVVMN